MFANSAMCILEIGDVPSYDVLVTIFTKFFGKNSVFCAKNSSILVSTRNDYISRECVTKMEFPEGRLGGRGSIL